MLRLLWVLVSSIFFSVNALSVGAEEASDPSQGLPQFRSIYTSGSRYLIIEVLRDDLLHFETASDGQPDLAHRLYTTPMVNKTDYPGPTEYESSATGIETLSLTVTVDQNLCVATYDKVAGVTLNKTCPADLESTWKGLTIESPETQNIYGLGQYFSDENADGDWLGRVWDPLPDSYGAQLRGFHGGANSYSMFPIMYALGQGQHSYAMFLDQIYKQMWDFRGAPWQIGMWGDQIRWYLFSGPDLPSLRRSYMELTGKPPVPPKRSFGLWVSEFGFSNWNELRSELASLRQKKFPVDGFALDLQWFGGTFGDPDRSRMGSLSWDEQNFPSPRQEVERLARDEGVNLMPIEEPFISETLQEHQELAARGYLAKDCEGCGPTYLNYNPWWGRGGMLDFTNPQGAEFWHQYRRRPLVAMGITDHWADLGEPEQYNSTAWYYGFPELNKHSHMDIHNIYGFKWMESIWRGYANSHETKRPFLLSRTGTSGIQRFGAGLWSGDIGTNWGNLSSQMQVQMHMSLSGVDYYGSDVGGFQRNDNVKGGADRLYTQWFAASAALDVPLRPHGWNLDKRRSTSPAKRGDPSSNLGNLRQRYELAPYYYSLAHLANRFGDPVFPPLVHYYQADRKLRRIGSEKLIGRDLLVALVSENDQVSRDVYLPAGRWVDFHSLETYQSESGQTVYERPLYTQSYFQLPLFARAGAIIPMAKVDDLTMNIRGKRSDGSVVNDLRLRVFADRQPSRFDLYEDDGETVAYRKNQVAITHLSQVQETVAGNEVAKLTVATTQGSYQGMSPSRSYSIEWFVQDTEAVSVTLNGLSLPECRGRGLASMSCFSKGSHGLLRVQTEPLSVLSEKNFVVSVKTRTTSSTSLYLVCRNGVTDPGSSVYAVGNVDMLGNWNPALALKLNPGPYPIWTAKVGNLPSNARVEWKCLKKHDQSGAVTEWQVGENNVKKSGRSQYSGESSGEF